MDEDDGEFFMPCAANSRWVIHDTHPSDRYCEAHKAVYLEHLAEGAGMAPSEIQREMEGKSLLTIERSEQCEEVMEQGMCGRPAKWVFVETWEHQFCDRHASEWDAGLGDEGRTPRRVGTSFH